jgi:hypothetical protein
MKVEFMVLPLERREMELCEGLEAWKAGADDACVDLYYALVDGGKQRMYIWIC